MDVKFVYFILGFDCQQDKEWESYWTKLFETTLTFLEKSYNKKVRLGGIFCNPSLFDTTITVIKKAVCSLPPKTNGFIEEIRKKITGDLEANRCKDALIIGQSYGGLVASLVGGSIAGNSALKDRVRVVTLGSIYTPRIPSFDILHIINHGDKAFSCNELPRQSDITKQYYDKEKQVLYTVPTIKKFKFPFHPLRTKAWQIHADYGYARSGLPCYSGDESKSCTLYIFNFDFLTPFINDTPFIEEEMPVSVNDKGRTFSNNEGNNGNNSEPLGLSEPPPNSAPAPTRNASNNAADAEVKKQQATILVNIPRLPTSSMFGINTHKGSYFRSIKPLVIEELTQKLIDAKQVFNESLKTYLQLPEFLEFLIIILRYYRKYHDIDKTIDEDAAKQIAPAFFLSGAFADTNTREALHLKTNIVTLLVQFIKDRLVDVAKNVNSRKTRIITKPILQITIDYMIDLLTMLSGWRNRWDVSYFTNTDGFTPSVISELRGVTGALDKKQSDRVTYAINTFVNAIKTSRSHNVAGSVYYTNSASSVSTSPSVLKESPEEFGLRRLREAEERAASRVNALAAAKAAKKAANGAPALFGGRTRKRNRNRNRKTQKRR